jgi:hypothetical protein
MPRIKRGIADISPIETSLKFAVLTYFRHSRGGGPWSGHRPGVTFGSGHRLQGGLRMSLQDHIETLREKHAALERAIDEENSRPLPNDDTISELKRQKLRIKDEIFQLESH